jgi:Ca2+-binding EF-hand superfamily protein
VRSWPVPCPPPPLTAPLPSRAVPDELLNMDEEGPKSTNLVAAEKLLQDKLYNKFGQVQKAFRLFDEDKSGELSYDEFRRAMHTLNISLNEEMMMALVAKFDPEHEGAISYENFNAYVGKILHVSAKDESASMLELEKFGGMQDGLTFNPNAHNANKAKDRGFSEGALGSHGPAAHVNLIDGMAEFKDEEEDPTASSISPPPAAPRSVAGSVHAPPAVAVAGRRDSRDSLRAAAAVPEARRASAAGVPYNAAPRVVRANSIATDEFDLAGTEEKMRRVLGRSWVQVFSDVKKASGRAPSLSSDSFRDVMAERGVPLTSREVRALAARYSGGAAGEVDAESLLRNTFKARPGTAAARPSLGRTGAPVPVAAPTAFTRPPTGQATARPSSAFVRAPVGPQVHAATGKMIF